MRWPSACRKRAVSCRPGDGAGPAGRETIGGGRRPRGSSGRGRIRRFGVNAMTAPTTTWTRLARRLGTDHNPLRRRSDLIAAWLRPAVLAVFLAAIPLAVGAASAWAHAGDAAAWRAQRSWHRVPAVLLAAVPGPMMSDGGANTWVTWTPARWTAGGRPHVGRVPAAAGTPAGAVVPAWLDRAGNVRRPLTAGQVRDRVLATASVAMAALAVFLGCLAAGVRRVLDRRRLAGWEAAWLAADPLGSPPA